MKFLLDQDVYAVTARFLVGAGHDVVLAAEIGMSTADDEDLLQKAQAERRIFITRDRDFGHLVFVKGFGAGVLYLRILPSSIAGVHAELARVLETYSEDELRNAFVVIEPAAHRFRKPLN
jgi:predicted nuclease of predicted toxin-antitoxin system